MQKRILRGYESFNAGDYNRGLMTVYLFGFSRGLLEVRSIAGFIIDMQTFRIKMTINQDQLMSIRINQYLKLTRDKTMTNRDIMDVLESW